MNYSTGLNEAQSYLFEIRTLCESDRSSEDIVAQILNLVERGQDESIADSIDIEWEPGSDIIGHLVETSRRRQRSIRITDEYDLPAIATLFGWSPAEFENDFPEMSNGRRYVVGEWSDARSPCEHHDTDGQTDCRLCGATMQQFVESAQEWLAGVDQCVTVFYAGDKNSVALDRRGEITLNFNSVYWGRKPRLKQSDR